MHGTFSPSVEMLFLAGHFFEGDNLCIELLNQNRHDRSTVSCMESRVRL
jgi:hypothetical protein